MTTSFCYTWVGISEQSMGKAKIYDHLLSVKTEKFTKKCKQVHFWVDER